MEIECNVPVTNEDIFALLKQSIKQNLEIKDELKEIRQVISAHNEAVSKIESKVNSLSLKYDKLHTEVLNIQRRLRRNNLIFFGVDGNTEESLPDIITNLVSQNLGVNLSRAEINNVYRLRVNDGSGKPRPILLELTTYRSKLEILEKKYLLKGKSISISEDLIPVDREEHKVLYSHYQSAKRKGYSARLKKNSVVINGQIYKYEDLKDQELPRYDPIPLSAPRKSVSAPSSPTFGLQSTSGVSQTLQSQANEKVSQATNNIQPMVFETRGSDEEELTVDITSAGTATRSRTGSRGGSKESKNKRPKGGISNSTK